MTKKIGVAWMLGAFTWAHAFGQATPPQETSSGAAPLALSQAADQSWASDFATPPDSAAPHTWWHWMNGNVTREGITADLEAMQRIGIRSATIVTVGISIPDGSVNYLSPAWLDMVKFAAQEAQRLGIQLGMGNCAGWSNSGGPWVTPQYSMQMIVSSEARMTGPQHFSDTLPQPETRDGYYGDLKVVAFPTLPGDDVTAVSLSPKVTSNAPRFDGARLLQGKSTGLAMPSAGKPQYVQFEFAQPFEARALTFASGGGWSGEGQGKIEASDDGQTFRTLRSLQLTFKGPPVAYAMKPVTARFFRFVVDQATSSVGYVKIAKLDLSSGLRIPNYTGKSLYGQSADKSAPEISAVPDQMVIHPEQTVDLTSHLDKDGKLDWDVPAGKWTVLRFGYTTTGETNHPAAKAGVGLECDKLSRTAAKFYWDGVMPKMAQDLGPLMGKTFDHVLMDSYEVGGQNWSPNFREEFQKRRGYDMFTFLPVLAGRYVEGADQSERFLWDLRRTIAELFAENYYDYFDVMAHQAGLKLNIEPYDGPYESLRCGRDADRVMGEFWWPGGNDFSLKIASSVAHTYGKKIAGAESFTSFHGGWDMSPPTMKALGDMAFTRGINSYDFHRFVHQPWPNRAPGVTMGPWGSNLDRTNNWYEEGSAWIAYLSRCDYLLQKGLYVADLLYFDGLNIPNRIPTPSLKPGYSFDGCDEDVILHRLSVTNGRLTLPDGMSYQALVLPDTDKITPILLRKIKELADAGATIIGPKPSASPSLADYPNCDAEVKRLADELWGGGKIISGKRPEEVLSSLGVKPDFLADSPAQPLYIHRTDGDIDFYFISNQRSVDETMDCTFRVTGKIPELWHPDTGKSEKVAAYTEGEGCTHLLLHLDSIGSVFVVFRPGPQGADHLISVMRTGEEPSPLHPDDLVITHAIYHGALGKASFDVTAQLATLVKNGRLDVQVNTQLFGKDPAPNAPKELTVDYVLNGVAKSTSVPEGDFLDLVPISSAFPEYALNSDEHGGINLEAWTPGTYEIKTAAGKTMRENVTDVARPAEITGSWDLDFPPNWGAPDHVSLDHLISWPEDPEPGVKYFSGTATYHKTMTVPPELLGKQHRLYLDLGEVQVIAQVSLNGKDLGTLWKPPYRVEITGAAQPGNNDLEIKVTNLWPNRLIGDEQLPEDSEWNPDGSLKAWPQWFLEGKPSPTGRVTFATWKHYNKSSPLFPSGLIGPVTLLPAVEFPLPVSASSR